ncbi:tRNA pseudouridine synthase A [Phaeobacter sp. CECT 5382]|nr:tRNA pseudouridine synthase A [Phaeobacter sp. CECT 5382]
MIPEWLGHLPQACCRVTCPPMPRFALKVEYHGKPFAGWQRQKDLPTVQSAVETALSRLEPGPHTIAAAGRTDAGVHGLGQVAHCDLKKDWDPYRLSEALNYHLKPDPVAIVACAQVADDWHARFTAIERQYLFRILVRRPPATLEAGQVWQLRNDLDLEAMQEAAQHLVGTHDFTTFRSTICQAKSPIKALDELRIERVAGFSGPEIHFHVRARSFLHNQVRSFVGTLERVGAGTWDPIDVKTALEARDRTACGPVCPGHGLYLARVGYPDPVFASDT